MPNMGGTTCEDTGVCQNAGKYPLCVLTDETEKQYNCENMWPNCGHIGEGESECGLNGQSGECRPLLCSELNT